LGQWGIGRAGSVDGKQCNQGGDEHDEVPSVVQKVFKKLGLT
jgi:hypothetical protein